MKRESPHIKEKLEGILKSLNHDYRQGKFFCSSLTIKIDKDHLCKQFYGFVPHDFIGKEIIYESTIMGEGKNRNTQLQKVQLKEKEYSIRSHMLLNDAYNAIHPSGKHKWKNP